MPKNQSITITTDFGDQFAAVQLQAVAISLGYTGKIIENHSVTPFSISEGAFEIATLARFSPPGAVHLGVVDPGVGSGRRGIVVKSENFWLVGPDNGLLLFGTGQDKIKSAWQLREDKIDPKHSNTFHGRDIFIKAAVYLAQGENPESFGSIEVELGSLRRLKLNDGQVLHIDHYGNIKVHWSGEMKLGKKLRVESKQMKTDLPIVKTFSDVAPQKPLALVGSSNTLEIAINLGNAAKYYGITIKDRLSIVCK